jgi:hypothetical protein
MARLRLARLRRPGLYFRGSAACGLLLVLLGAACNPGILARGGDGPRRDDALTAERSLLDVPSAVDAADTLDRDTVARDKPAATADKGAIKDQPAAVVDKLATKDKPAGDKGPVTDGGGGPTIGGCPVFPSTNPWNTDISQDLVDPSSAAIIAAINAAGGTTLHADFSSTQGWNPPYGAGIPYVVVPGTQPKACVKFQYASQSEPGPYPIPPSAPIEGGPSSSGDRHILVIDKDTCKLYETWSSSWDAAQSCWTCGSGAVFDLTSNVLRPDCWTSADAAGLPVFAGLVRYDEAVTAGEIKHAIRVTFDKTRQAFLHPATHYASSDTSVNLPPMGLRLRLKASTNISTFTGAAKVILVALKKYGMIVADNGSNWYLSGAPHPSWDDGNLNTLKTVPGTAFEVVKPTGKLYTIADCP